MSGDGLTWVMVTEPSSLSPPSDCSIRRSTGSIALPEEVKMVMPGDNVKVSVELITPVPLEEQQRFAIREGVKTVGAGVVTKILV